MEGVFGCVHEVLTTHQVQIKYSILQTKGHKVIVEALIRLNDAEAEMLVLHLDVEFGVDCFELDISHFHDHSNEVLQDET